MTCPLSSTARLWHETNQTSSGRRIVVTVPTSVTRLMAINKQEKKKQTAFFLASVQIAASWMKMIRYEANEWMYNKMSFVEKPKLSALY